jgi:hypothetical protein
MGITACIVGAVASKEMCASRHTMISWLMGQVAVLAGGTLPAAQEIFADCDFVWIVRESTAGSKWTFSCNIS